MLEGDTPTPALVSRMLSETNLPTVRQMEAFQKPTLIKTGWALEVFEHLALLEPELREQRQWSLGLFQTLARAYITQNPQKVIEFLSQDGVFDSADPFLICPKLVQPQMECANLKPDNYPSPLDQDVKQITEWMFAEYFSVKSLLSFPGWRELTNFFLDRLSARSASFRDIPFLETRLRLSFLLKDYLAQILSEAKKTPGHLITVFGPGKGEELVELIKKGYSVFCFDAHQSTTLKNLFEETFIQAGMATPHIQTITGKADEVDVSPLKKWEEQDQPATIFTYSTDFSEKEAIPDKLRRQLEYRCPVAASIYTLHEIPLDKRKNLIKNMLSVTAEGSLVIFDGYPSADALLRVILPVILKSGALITGHDAIITHLLCLTPEQLNQLINQALAEAPQEGIIPSARKSKVEVVNPPSLLSHPNMLGPLQTAVVVRPAEPMLFYPS